MNTTKYRLITSALTLAFLALGVWSFSATRAIGSPAADEARALYVQKCASCHAADGSGNTAKGRETQVHDLRSEEVQKMTDAKLLEIILKGSKKMPGYEKSLGVEKCKGLLAYIRELAKKK